MCFLPLLVQQQFASADHEFVFESPKNYSRVNVAGSFNNWNKDANPLKLGTGGQRWTTRLKLQPGRYSYKFVLDGETWITDPKALKDESDGNGNTNSVVLVTPPGYDKPAKLNDGVITPSALQHLTEVPFLNYDRGLLTLTLRTRPHDVANITVALAGTGSYPMVDEGGDEFYEQYSVRIPWNRKSDLRYRFVLSDSRAAMVFGPHGLTSPTVPNDFVVKASTYHPFEVPHWVEKSVIYHIFPDRFANGNAKNDPKGVEGWDGKPTFRNFFGGDVLGVKRHLGYLKDLGISAVFFNPVFKGPSNHRYETTDYLQIDPIFGTNTEFIDLTHEFKKYGIRTILDGVFNHTATSFAPFADVVKNGANSKYTHWYTFKSYPVRTTTNPNYVAWFNYPSMPKLNYSNSETRKYMLGIPEFWQTKAGIDGWRLDAANEVVPDYWQDFRKKVKSINPEAWIVGEVWGDGSPWLKGDQWDSVMNYPFREAVLGFVTPSGSGKPSDTLQRLMSNYTRYAPQVSRNLMNLISSHDTARILTLCGGDRSLAQLAAALQFTWVGTPSIYYGDEIGMEGDRDPDNRRPMAWQHANARNDFLELYRKLIHIRNSDKAMQSGDPLPLVADDAKQLLCFARVLDDKADIVALNRSDQVQNLDLKLEAFAGLPKAIRNTQFIDALSGKVFVPTESILHLRLSPRSAAVLIPRSGSFINSSHFNRSSGTATVAMSSALVSKELP